MQNSYILSNDKLFDKEIWKSQYYAYYSYLHKLGIAMASITTIIIGSNLLLQPIFRTKLSTKMTHNADVPSTHQFNSINNEHNGNNFLESTSMFKNIETKTMPRAESKTLHK